MLSVDLIVMGSETLDIIAGHGVYEHHLSGMGYIVTQDGFRDIGTYLIGQGGETYL